MLDSFPEAAVVQMRVVEQRLGRADGPPGEAALLRGVIHLLRRQAGDEIGDQLVDDMRGVGRDHRRVLIFRVLQIAGHPIAVQQVGQFPDVFRIEPTPDQRADIGAVPGAELGARRRAGSVMTARVPLQHLAAIDVIRDRRFGRQRARLMDRRVDILAFAGRRFGEPERP